VCFNLRQQRRMLMPGGAVTRNLRAVQRVQIGLVRPGSPLPSVDDGPRRAALQGGAHGQPTP